MDDMTPEKKMEKQLKQQRIIREELERLQQAQNKPAEDSEPETKS